MPLLELLHLEFQLVRQVPIVVPANLDPKDRRVVRIR